MPFLAFDNTLNMWTIMDEAGAQAPAVPNDPAPPPQPVQILGPNGWVAPQWGFFDEPTLFLDWINPAFVISVGEFETDLGITLDPPDETAYNFQFIFGLEDRRNKIDYFNRLPEHERRNVVSYAWGFNTSASKRNSLTDFYFGQSHSEEFFAEYPNINIYLRKRFSFETMSFKNVRNIKKKVVRREILDDDECI